ncbi:MAG: EAL domain-containing protein [Alphaproteobacteria bacterium]|nr:EAL domain-containing protein [Alphaproteobacteria bacterium]MBF0249571.1 EAL domain-containing protein [Alphaproteobacteria bacterium]
MDNSAIPLAEIEAALHAGELCFHYQPKISFHSGRIVGGEALLRWKKSDGSLVPPGLFLPQCEESGFITDITAVMVNELVQDIARLRALKPDIQIAFNVSALDLLSPYLVKMLRSYIGNQIISPGNIQIEITETAIVHQSGRIHATLLDLVALGVEIVMDDFGTGYSSLDALSQLPFSSLKIDQGVVGRMSEDPKNTHIVRSSLKMARDMNIKTIAEGIENETVYAFLLASGCSEAQGFWMARPQPIESFIQVLKDDPSWPSCELGFLYNAWSNHLAYRRKVLDTVYTMTMTRPEEWVNLPKMDLRHHAAYCRLGQWYRDMEKAGFSERVYKRLKDLHNQMHVAGDALIKTVKAQPDHEAIIEASNAFLQLSEQVDQEVSRIVALSFAEGLRENFSRADDEDDARNELPRFSRFS